MSELPQIGFLKLDTVQFPTDPTTYEPLNWEKRTSFHPALGGVATIQDFGVVKRDAVVELASGDNWIDDDTVKALHLRFRDRGKVYVLTDWKGNEFEVFIEAFRPVVVFGQPEFWTYSMTLRVRTITKLLGDPFTGL